MKRLILLAYLLCGCHTTAHLNRKYHIDTGKPVDYSTIKINRFVPEDDFQKRFNSLDSTHKRIFLDSMMHRVDSILNKIKRDKYRETHIEV